MGDDLQITKGSVSYLSSPCFSTSLGGIGGPARGIHGILAVMYWISIIRGGHPGDGLLGTMRQKAFNRNDLERERRNIHPQVIATRMFH